MKWKFLTRKSPMSDPTTPPPAIPPTLPPTMINVQIWKPPNATYFCLPMKTRIDHGSEKLFHRLQHRKELSGNFAFAFIYLWGKLGWLASSIQNLTYPQESSHGIPVQSRHHGPWIAHVQCISMNICDSIKLWHSAGSGDRSNAIALTQIFSTHAAPP